ncbi:MAG: DSD1 family PLP-dependent enzyme [Paracoccaceae bacterium]
MDGPSEWNGLEIGYDVPAAPGMAEGEIVTPALCLDLDALERNLAAMQAHADAAGLTLRPHAKTHRSADVGRLQVAAGAVGLCCQTLSEAEALARGGLSDLLVTNEVRGARRTARAARLAQEIRLGVCVDDAEGVAELAAAVLGTEATLEVYVEIEVGMGRCGVAPGVPAAHLAEAVAAAPGLRFAGLQAYNGRAQHIRDPDDRGAAIDAAAGAVRETLAALEAAGLPCPVVGGAGTGSWPLEAATGLWTELQCGSYAFMDADYATVRDESGAGPAFEHALFVLAEVMSVPAPGRAVCDAGLKALAMDSGPPRIKDREGLAWRGASDEHGLLDDPGGTLKVGDRLRLIPGHCDPTCNLHDWYVGLRGGRVEALWPVTARGKGF